MRDVMVRVPEADARDGARLEVYGPDANGDVDLASAITRVPVRQRVTPPRFLKEAFLRGPFLKAVRYARFLGSAFLQQPFLRAVREIALYGGRYEHGRLEFGVRTRDRMGNVSSSPPNTGRVLVISAPQGIADTTISVAAGVVTMAVTDKVG